MDRKDKILESFNKVADIALDNLPSDIILYQFVYVRDMAERGKDGKGDGDTVFRSISKNMRFFDVQNIREATNSVLDEIIREQK